MSDDKTDVPLSKVAPTQLAMVICDFVYRDPFNNKHTIIGTFNEINASEFPASHPHMTLYLMFTNGRGKTPLKLRIIDADDEHPPLFEATCEVEFPNPLLTVEMVVPLPPFGFPAAGEYRLQCIACETILLERRVFVIGPQEPTKGDDE